MKQGNQHILQGPLAGNILFYTLPIIATSFLQLLFNAADLVVVGRFCGSISVAAVGSTGSLTNLMVNLFIGLSIGAGISVAHAIGSGEADRIHRTVHTAVPLSMVGGVLLSVFGVVGCKRFLQLMGTPDTVLGLSAVYMRIYFAGAVFLVVYNFCAAILRAAGDTQSPLVILTGAGILNVLLNVLLVTVFRMNVAGVALATVTSEAVSAALGLWVLSRRSDAVQLRLAKLRFYPAELWKILRIGLPAGIQSSMFSLSNTVIQSSVNSFGAAMMSGCAAVGNVEGFLYATVNSFHQTAANYVGQNAGAKQYDRVKQVLLWCLGYVTAAGLLVGLGAYLNGRAILSLYITDSPEAIAIGMVRMAITCAPYCIYGIMDVITGSLRGLGASFVSMVLTILCVCVMRIVWVYTVFQVVRTPACLFVSWPFTWVLGLFAQLTAFCIIYRRQKAAVNAPAGIRL